MDKIKHSEQIQKQRSVENAMEIIRQARSRRKKKQNAKKPKFKQPWQRGNK